MGAIIMALATIIAAWSAAATPPLVRAAKPR
jgi:hypothetical protein